MNRALLSLLVCLPLIGGATCGVRSSTPAPVLAQCDAICYAPCLAPNGDTGVRWEGDPAMATTLDAIGEEVVPTLASKLRVCEASRKACVQCLDRLEKNGVILK